MWGTILTALACIATPLVAWFIYGLRPFFGLYHIPGPPMRWLRGSVPEIHYWMSHNFQAKFAAIYGPIFSAWGFQGHEVVISSPELIRQVLITHNNRVVLPSVAGSQKPFQHTKLMDDFLLYHIITAPDDKRGIWSSLRESFAPFFLPGSLEAFAEVMHERTLVLVKILGRAADSGEAVDMHRLFCDLALDVITQLSFGVELNVQDPENATGPFTEITKNLYADCEATFHGANATSWFIYCGMYPEFLWLTKALAAYFPDEGLRKYKEAQKRIINTVLTLLNHHRVALKQQAEEGVPETVVEDSAAPFAKGPGAAELNSTSSGLKPTASGLKGLNSGLSTKSSGIPAQRSGLGQRPSDLVTKIGKRRGVKKGSFLDLLAAGTDKSTGKPFSDGAIVRQGHAMIMAGYETTAISMGTSVYNLSQDPEAARKMETEADRQPEVPTLDSVETMNWADAVLRESMRLTPSAAVGGRQADRDCIIGGYKVKKGTHLKLSFCTMHRDPKLWKDPDTFKPARWIPDSPDFAGQTLKDAWAAFGGGGRGCPGQRLAMEEAKIALMHVYKHFRFELQPGQVPLPLRHNLTMSPSKGIWVKVHRRVK